MQFNCLLIGILFENALLRRSVSGMGYFKGELPQQQRFVLGDFFYPLWDFIACVVFITEREAILGKIG